jgi:aspartate-semialdehyde dehydrogenase
MKSHYKVAIVGASGLVGRTVLKVLEEQSLTNVEYVLFSSKKSAGLPIKFMGKSYIFCELTDNSFDLNFDFAIFAAGSDVAKHFAPIAVSKGCVVIDNSSAFRMNPEVPLVVPEVNPETISMNKGIIANPNCSTIQAVVPLKALDNKYFIKRIVYSTYQAVSGAGKSGIEDLKNSYTNIDQNVFPYSITNNCIPHIDTFMEDGYTKEEHKMINETRKILNRPNLPITATAVRVPVTNCHSESINVEFERSFDLYELKLTLQNFSNIIVVDDIENNKYPLASKANGNDEVFVGRIRKDFSVKSGINMWVVADNLRKGAATNAVQILKILLEA